MMMMDETQRGKINSRIGNKPPAARRRGWRCRSRTGKYVVLFAAYTSSVSLTSPQPAISTTASLLERLMTDFHNTIEVKSKKQKSLSKTVSEDHVEHGKSSMLVHSIWMAIGTVYADVKFALYPKGAVGRCLVRQMWEELEPAQESSLHLRPGTLFCLVPLVVVYSWRYVDGLDTRC